MPNQRLIHVVPALLIAALIGPACTPAPKTQPAAPAATRTANPPSRKPQIYSRLDRTIPEIQFDRMPFRDVLAHVRTETGITIDVNWNALHAVGVSGNEPVAAPLSPLNVKARKVIQVIIDSVSTAQTKLHYEVDDANDRLVISTYVDYAAHNTEVREYDIRDLIASWRKLSGESDAKLCGDVSDLVTEAIASESWVSLGGMPGSVMAIDGRLFITQTRENHRQIETLLQELRECPAAESLRLITPPASDPNDLL